MKRLHRKHLLAALAALTLGVAAPALAYVLPATAIFELFASQREKLKSDNQQVGGRLVITDAAGVRTVLPATHTLRFPGDCRFEIDEDGVAGELGGTHVIVRDGKLIAKAAGKLALLDELVSLACPVLSIKELGAEKLDALAKRWKIDLAYSGLSRLDDRMVYVVGAKPSEVEKPSIWFDKEKLLPVQVRTKSGEQLLELRMTGFNDPATGELHPREIQLRVDGKLRARFVAERLEQNLDLDPKLFKPAS
ncbi:MAG: hypothetical protein P1V51_00860 [Deltaproteobacteria bacterium]|nr:hypothetical protein [Deltaproteobacteria bacterium]